MGSAGPPAAVTTDSTTGITGVTGGGNDNNSTGTQDSDLAPTAAGKEPSKKNKKKPLDIVEFE